MPKKKQVRVNVRALANMAGIRREQRHGRAHIVVPSATLPDNVVMNDILYPADEIEASFRSLERSPAPNGHPMIGNQFVSARDPEGINMGWIGAWNENVRRENGRVFLDKVIDVQVAERTEGGKAVLNAIEAGDPIHTSTGLLCYLENANDGEDHKFIAREIEFDHDAILLNEEGAATPDQGVGMLVNADGEEQEIQVINSALDQAEESLDWAGMYLLDALERRDKATVWERIKSAIMEAVAPMRETTTNQEGDVDMADEKQLEEISAKVNGLSETVDKIGDTIANAVATAMKPLTDNLAEMQANQKAKDESELAELVNKIVKGGLMDEAPAKELTLNAARALAEKVKPGKAAPINGAGFTADPDDEWAGFTLNAAIDGKQGEAH